MATEQTEHLVHLVRSMSKAEKRNFKLYAQRNKGSDLKFLQLFDYIDRHKQYDDESALAKLTDVKRSQISNLKANLYKQLLKSLRLNYAQQDGVSNIRESVDFARLLFQKGLYKQSLKILDKAKQQAREWHQHVLVLEILEFEKVIESRYITSSLSTRAGELAKQASHSVSSLQKINDLSNLALSLYGLYVKVGYIRDVKDADMVTHFFKSNLPEYELEELSFHGKLYLYQSYACYSYMMQDFVQYYRYSRKWVEMFDSPALIQRDLELYIKGVHNLMLSLFYTLQYKNLCEAVDRLEKLQEEYSHVNDNIKIHLFLYTTMGKINRIFIEGQFTEGVKIVPEILERIDKYSYKLDAHRILLLYYKIACLYFGSGDNKSAIKFLNKIINTKDVSLREDIHCFARILNLIAHYELGNTDLLDYHIRSVYRFLNKMNELHAVHSEILRFLKNLQRITPSEINREFEHLRNRLVELRDDPFERRPFLYLDIISWLESKLENTEVQIVIQRNFQSLKR